MNQSTIEALKAMRFSAMAAEFERQLSEASTYGKLGFEERFSLLVDAEWNQRQKNKLIRAVRMAHFAVPGAMVEVLSTMRTAGWIKRSFSALLPVGILRRNIILF